MAVTRMLWLLCALSVVISAAADGGSDGEVLLRALTTLMQRSDRSEDSSSCSSAAEGWRDPALTMTLKQSTLDDINDFLANSLGAPIDLLGLTIPELDPLSVNHFAVDSEDPAIGKIYINVKGISITGLSTIELQSVKLNVLQPPLNFQIRLAANDVHVQSSDYLINCSIADTFDFTGYGAMWFDAYGVKLYADIDLNGFSLSSLHINTLDLSIEKFQVSEAGRLFQSYFGNLMGGGETGTLVNDVLDTMVPDLAQALADIIKGMVNKSGASNTTSTTLSPTTVA